MKDTSLLKPRRKYDLTFKREAVKHWLASGQSAERVARELGIGAERLYVWKQRLRPPNASESEDLRAQLEATRQELARVTEQRDILKKTLGIVSEPAPKGMSGSRL
jgi:transposase